MGIASNAGKKHDGDFMDSSQAGQPFYFSFVPLSVLSRHARKLCKQHFADDADAQLGSGSQCVHH